MNAYEREALNHAAKTGNKAVLTTEYGTFFGFVGKTIAGWSITNNLESVVIPECDVLSGGIISRSFTV